MAYKSITKHNAPAYTRANRKRGDVKEITLHQWDDIRRGPTFDGTVNWLVRPSATTSGHYVVEAGLVACLVSPKHIAWGNGNWESNKESIVIELNPRASAADYATAAELIRELEAVYGRVRIGEHRQHKATSCPGSWSASSMRELVDGKKVAKAGTYYTIKYGDTLGAIAAKARTTVAKLAKLNGIKNPNRVAAGQKIRTK